MGDVRKAVADAMESSGLNAQLKKLTDDLHRDLQQSLEALRASLAKTTPAKTTPERPTLVKAAEKLEGLTKGQTSMILAATMVLAKQLNRPHHQEIADMLKAEIAFHLAKSTSGRFPDALAAAVDRVVERVLGK